ncbi:MAG: TolC family protein [Gemmatimonadaceae bacterium]
MKRKSPSPLHMLRALAALALTIGAAATKVEAQDVRPARQVSLDDALRAAEATSEDIAIARAGITRARGELYRARSEFLPQVFGSALYTKTLESQFDVLSQPDTTTPPRSCNSFLPNPSLPLDQRVDSLFAALGCSAGGGLDFSNLPFGRENEFRLGLTASQTLFTGGRLVAQRRAANAGKNVADISFASARAQTMLTVAEAYYDAVLSDRLVTIANATLQQAETTLVQTQLARQVGNQPEFELLRAQVTRDNQRPIAIQRRTDRDLAYMRLKQLLNVPVEENLILTTDLGDSTPVGPTNVAAVALESGVTATQKADTATDQRAPVRQAAEGVRVQESAVTIARSQRIPAVSLTSSYGKVGYPVSGFPSWNDFLNNWTVGVGIQLPIFTGGRIRGDELVARGSLEEAKAQLQQVRELASLDTRSAFARLESAAAEWESSLGTVEQASRAYTIAELRYREGISTQTEISDSRILLQQAQANRALAARNYQVARMRLALIRDLPIGAFGAQSAGGFGSQPAQQDSRQSAPPQRQRPQQAAGQVQASQTGVTP